MKKILSLLIGLGLTLFTGCIVLSVYPFYNASDVAFDPALVGSWSEHGSRDDANNHWEFSRLGEQAYLLTTVNPSETNGFIAHRFQLKGETFLDLFPTNRAVMAMPLHGLLKIVQGEPVLQIKALDYKWLEQLLAKNPQAIRHIADPPQPGGTKPRRVFLTADTKELQAFILNYSRDTNAFTRPVEMKRWSK